MHDNRSGTDEMNQEYSYRILWQKRTDGEAVLLRMYGQSAQVIVPEQIAGYPVSEAAPYCFAESSHYPAGEILEEVIGKGDFLQELCGNALEEVYLPESVTRIGKCAFYNCRNLKTLSIGADTTDIGSDAFMNTRLLHQIFLRASITKPSGIKQILSQISADIEVIFEKEDKIEAKLLYPEYYESYDEIAPAHLFGRSITGEGFRARECIKDGVVDFGGYDAVFLQACVEENETTLSKMALNRLQYPCLLGAENRKNYEGYLAEHIRTIGNRLIKEKKLKILQFLCQENLLAGQNLAEMIRVAAECDWPEGAASLLQQKAEKEQSIKQSRYEFDDF